MPAVMRDIASAAAFALIALAAYAQPAAAQDPSIVAPAVAKSSAFPKNSLVGPSHNIDKSQPLLPAGRRADLRQIGGNRVIARGNVEIFYNNYILTADEVVYDQTANTLTAVGNVTLKEPKATSSTPTATR